MKLRRKLIALLLVLALAITYVPAAFAQDGVDPLPPCSGGQVAGTVIAVDPTTGVVTVQTAEGACTVTLSGSYDHPIVTLLGVYFGDISPESFEDALNDTRGCALLDPATGAYNWSDCGADGAVPVQIISDNGDGTYNAQLVGGEMVLLGQVDAEAAARIGEALAALAADWALDENGDVIQVSDEVAAYHDDGMGFGVLVKLYAIAYTSGVPVADLVAQFESGVGMGELFKEYGKPTATGVGHLRPKNKNKDKAPETSVDDQGETQEPAADTTGTQTQPPANKTDKSKTTGVCNARTNGGKAKANGKAPLNCP